MRVLVTGGAGYVGSVVVSTLLRDGHDVRVLDSLMHGGAALLGVWSDPGFEFHGGDVRDGAAVGRALEGVEAVVHLAAIVGDPACARDPDLARAVNLEASLDLLAAAREAGVVRFLFASTCSNYGRMRDASACVDERSELRPVSLYAETKVAVERALLETSGPGDFSPTCLRLATVFGVSPRMRFDLTVNEFAMEMIVRKELVVFGEQFWRPYVHVRDVASAVALVLGAPLGRVRREVFNVGSTRQNYRKQDLVAMIRPHAPDARVTYVHKDEDPRDYRVSFGKIESVLGFAPRYTVEDGIREIARLIDADLIRDYTDGRYRN
jgi:nucleoside-diphosphate-sugar epimerase